MFNVSLNTGSANYSVANLGPQGSQSLFSVNDMGSIVINDLGSNAFGPAVAGYYACIVFCDQIWAFAYDAGGELNMSYDQDTLTVTATNGTVTQITPS